MNEPLERDFLERFEAKLLREHPYFAERGLSPELVATFRLGYYPDEGRGMMRNRLVIPIFTWDGHLVAYAGRWVGSEDTLPEGRVGTSSRRASGRSSSSTTSTVSAGAPTSSWSKATSASSGSIP